MVDIAVNDYVFGPQVEITKTEMYPKGTKVTTHSEFQQGKGLVGYNKIVELPPKSPLRKSGVKGFVYGTFVDKFVKTKDGKPLSLSSQYTCKVSPDYKNKPIQNRSELVMIDKKNQLLARGKEQVKTLIRNIKENGLKIVKR